MIKLLLIDIDGTLLTSKHPSHPTNNRFYTSLKDIFGIEAEYDRQKFNGWTDYQILTEMVKPFGINKKELDPRLDEIADSMINRIIEISRGDNFFHVIPGVREFLAKVHELPIHKGVFTGNLSKVGKWKLSTNHIDKFFSFELFGDYMKDKTELLQKELTPLLSKTGGGIKKDNCCVIGDTPPDIEAGKSMGIKTIGVLSSIYTKKSEMQRMQPDLLVSSLNDVETMEFIRI